MDSEWPEPELLVAEVAEARQPSRQWWILATVMLSVVGGVFIVTTGVAPTEPVVRVNSMGECAWSGAEVAAGLVDIEFVNESNEAVWVKFSPLVEGATVAEVIAATPDTGDLHDYEELPMFLDRGHNTREVEPGSTDTFKVALTRPADYAVSCSRTEPTYVDGVPVAATKALRVLPAE